MHLQARNVPREVYYTRDGDEYVVRAVMVDGSEAHRRGIQQLVPAGDGTADLLPRPARSVPVHIYEQHWHPAAVPQQTAALVLHPGATRVWPTPATEPPTE